MEPIETKPYLTHLFKAYFTDGSMLEQSQDDVSTLDPEKRSAFFDVLNALEQGRTLERFEVEGSGHVYSVNLLNGVFAIDGVEFGCNEQFMEPSEPLKLVYFRDTRVDSKMNFNTKQEVDRDHFVAAYYIGWEAKDKTGKQHKYTISFN